MNAKWFPGVVAAVSSALACGCAVTPTAESSSNGNGLEAQSRSPSGHGIATEAQRFASGQPDELRPFFRALYIEGEHNAVLNFDYLGLAALESGQYEISAKAFDAAISRIEAIYANNPSAQKAKSLFAEEKVKDFKGEPYERAMTYFYRGLLYAHSGDYQNARASFLSAESQSMMSESESYQSTFGLMDYLAGWASYCDGDDSAAAELGARAATLQPQIFGVLSDQVNFIGLIDVGTGPVKYGIGQYHEKLAFKASGRTPGVADVHVSSATLSAPTLAADLNFQAMTRGGRPVDAILNGKAEWKSNTEGASTALTAAGYTATLEGAVTNNQNLQSAGEIGMVVGLMGGLFAKAMTPAADMRTWSSLPAAIVLVAGQLPSGTAPAMTFTVAPDGSPASASLAAHAGRCSIAWGEAPSRLESAAAQVATPVLAEGRHEAANAQLRSYLETTFAGGQAASIAEQPGSAVRSEAP